MKEVKWSEWKSSGKGTELRYEMKDDDHCVWNGKIKSCFKHVLCLTFQKPFLSLCYGKILGQRWQPEKGEAASAPCPRSNQQQGSTCIPVHMHSHVCLYPLPVLHRGHTCPYHPPRADTNGHLPRSLSGWQPGAWAVCSQSLHSDPHAHRHNV